MLCTKEMDLTGIAIPVNAVQGMRGIAKHLGADRGMPVVFIDTREELNIYLGGKPYSRRDLDMPTTLIHHTGIHWRELAKLEGWLLEDVRASGQEWSTDGLLRVLVHHEAMVCLHDLRVNVLASTMEPNIDTSGPMFCGRISETFPA